ncbi:MAG: AbrB/MazE/SpoVT family DNA-binding domain-containing protein [Gammaproteobacteria bacterium]|nr:AbrB/MazE/SpoVT family DNA-binding domain-containing protein [Gammaproteobacteria bacterium]
METTKLSSKCQVIIPKRLRASHRWEAGLELVVIDTADGILLRPRAPFPGSELDQVAGMLEDRVKPKTDVEIEAAIRRGVKEQWRGSR